MKNQDKLNSAQITEALAQLPQWQAITADDNDTLPTAIQQSFQFTNFRQAFACMTQIALLAEKLNHHPDLYNSYNKVQVRLTSHDVKGISRRDINMAQKINVIINV